MSDLETKIEPVSASADGKRNMHSMCCDVISQSMNYAACLWRQGVLSKPDIKTPADWSQCGTAGRDGRCPAIGMQREEELAGKAIFFEDRHAKRERKTWGEKPASIFCLKPSELVVPTSLTNTGQGPAFPKVSKYERHMVPKSMLDAMGSAGDLSDAITAAVKTASAPVFTRPVEFITRSGESPLAMARRMAAERSLTN